MLTRTSLVLGKKSICVSSFSITRSFVWKPENNGSDGNKKRSWRERRITEDWRKRERDPVVQTDILNSYWMNCANSHDPQRIHPDHCGDPLTFPLFVVLDGFTWDLLLFLFLPEPSGQNVKGPNLHEQIPARQWQPRLRLALANANMLKSDVAHCKTLGVCSKPNP